MHPYVLGVIGGFLLGIGTVLFSWWPLSLFSFAVVMYILKHVQERRTLVYALWLFGAVAYGFSFYGIYWETMPLDWLGLPNATAVGILGSIWLLTILVFSGVFTAVFFYGRLLLTQRWFDGILVAALYTIADVVGMFLYSLVFYGNNARLGAHFSMGSPAYQLADSALFLQAASLGGLYGLLFLQAFVGAMLYVLLQMLPTLSYKVYGAMAFVGCVFVLTQVSLPSESPSNFPTIKVGVVSLYDIAKHESNTFRARLKETLWSLPPDTDVIALPEDSRFIQYLDETEATEVGDYFLDTYILDSGTVATIDGFVPEVQYYSGAKKETTLSSKDFLMIFGEYMPYLYIGIGNMIGRGDVVDTIINDHGYITKPSRLFEYNGNMLSAKLCSDAMSPTLYADDTAEGAQVLFNLASHGWFHRSELLYSLALRVGKTRAVESGRWYVRAAYETPAAVIDEKGNVVMETPWLMDAAPVVEVPLRSNKTPYTIFRTWVLLVPVSLIVLFAIINRRARITTSHTGG